MFYQDEDEDYYEPKLINTAFKNNYSQYQTTSDRKNMLTPHEYLKKIEAGLTHLINKRENDSWKIQLTMKIIFTPIEDFNDKRALYVKTKNVEIMMGSDTNETVKELFESIIKTHQELMEYSTKNSGLILEGVELMNYDINKNTINRGSSYIESPTSLKSKKCTINPQNKNDTNCFQNALTVTLNYEKTNNHPEKLSKIEPFIYQYKWSEINFPSHQKDWKKFESNNKSIALNILYLPHNTKDIRHAYKSQFNLTREHQVTLLMISDKGEKWHYSCVKKLGALLRGISSNHNGDVYCTNCFKSFKTKSKLEIHKKMCENRDYCYVQMPNNKNKILEYKHSQKSKRAPFLIYSDLECLPQRPKIKIMIKINQQSKLIILFLMDIQCILSAHLIILNIN